MQVYKSAEMVFLSCVAAFLLVAPALGADVLSSRPTGVIKISLSTNEQKLVCLPFRPFDASIDAVLSGQLQGTADERTADRVIKWDSSALKYEHAYKANGTGDKKTDGKWFSSFDPLAPSHFTLSPGEGFFLWNRQSVTQDVFLSGEVALETTNAITINPSLNLLGYPYSTMLPADNGLPCGVVGEQGRSMAEGFWVHNTSGVETVWLETRPYKDVFPSEGEKPEIAGISVNPPVPWAVSSNRTITLTIDCAGLSGNAKLDIYYKDLQETEGFESECGWSIADTDIPVRGRKIIEWTDSGNFSRKPVNEVFARYYLVGRADIDADKDGTPDARQKFVFGKSVPVDAGSEELALGTNSTLASEVSTNLPASTNSVALRFPPAAMLARVIYVDQKTGSDTLSGKSPVVVVPDGPKKTIRAGVDAAAPGETVVIKEGLYGESLNVAGRNVSVRFTGKVDLRGRKDNAAVLTMPVEGLSSNLVDIGK